MTQPCGRTFALVALLTLATILAAPAQAEQAAQSGPAGASTGALNSVVLPIIHGAKLSTSGKTTRLEFAVAGVLKANAFVLADPERAIIDLPETLFRLDAASAGRRGGMIASYRFGLVQPGRSRLVIDLARPARIVSSDYQKLEGEAGRLTLVLESVPKAQFQALAGLRSGAPPEPQKAGEATDSVAAAREPFALRLRPRTGRIVVAVDPGHGGIDGGAIGRSRVQEKEITLEFARALARQLEASGRYQVIMTRDSDVFVPLGERVRIAREAGAKLFVSIHADTLNEKYVNGATIYTLSDKASDSHAARLAAKENLADKIAGHVSKQDQDQVGDILADLARRETRTFSHVFARSLVAYWKDAGRLNKNPLRSAGFTVLRAHDVPSVLLELGYLSSQSDSADLASAKWRAKAAGSVVSAVDAFFAQPNRRVELNAAGEPERIEEKPAGGTPGVAAASHSQ